MQPKMSNTRIVSLLWAFLALMVASAVHAQSERRVALVIGNGAYEAAPLRNPVNDANDLASVLEQLDFEVIHLTNATRSQMNEAVRRFGREIRQGGVGLFYFAGHGIQMDGRNFLIPIGADIEEEFEIETESVEASRVLRAMVAADNGLNIVILDACRNNPLERSFRSSVRGLTRMPAPTGSVVAYATAPNSVAADGDGRNGTYTKHLLEQMQIPDQKLEDVFKQVRIQVERETAGAQVPWEESSLTGDFYFVSGDAGGTAVTPPPSVAEASPSLDEARREQLIWQGISDSNDVADFEQFLADFPNGNFASYARTRLARLREGQREQLAWQEIANSGDPAAFERFLADFPNGDFADDARGRLARLREEDADRTAPQQRSTNPLATLAFESPSELPAPNDFFDPSGQLEQLAQIERTDFGVPPTTQLHARPDSDIHSGRLGDHDSRNHPAHGARSTVRVARCPRRAADGADGRFGCDRGRPSGRHLQRSNAAAIR
jgi:uncharacterized caspase-like protein